MPDSVTEPYTSETIELLQNRVSTRKYSDEPVPDEMVETILRAAYRSPTSSNIQSYTTIVVRNPETKQKLSVSTGNQKHVADTPVFLAFCADMTRIDYALMKHQHNLNNNNMETGLVTSIDATLVGMSAYLVAESLGLRGLMIGGVRNNAVEIAEILGLPNRVYCVFGMCLGWPAEQPSQKPRMDIGATIHYERYDADATLASLDTYDSALAEHYEAIGKATTPDSWTHDMDKKFHPPLRDSLREQLKKQGFDFR
ncbi:MAG: oxygen-insensitive NADPH nitroreductase [Alphaproteobacteria bacterium]|nr:oxygen-insensitive NADPH nitroreductase [Alphaproteobacteria bacterium]